MRYGHGNRDYLLPKGCKDLIDAKHVPREAEADVSQQEDGILFKFKAAELRPMDAAIRLGQSSLRLVFYGAYERVFAVPRGYNSSAALITYIGDEVRVFVPKC